MLRIFVGYNYDEEKEKYPDMKTPYFKLSPCNVKNICILGVEVGKENFQ